MPVLLYLKKFLLHNFKIFLFIIFFVFFTILLLWISYFFRVKKIQVFGQSSNFIFHGIAELKDENILLLSEEKIEKQLYQVNPSVKSIQIKKELPQTLLVIIEEGKPLAIFKASGGNFYLSQSGRVIFKKKEITGEILPIINFYQKIDFNTISSGDSLDYGEILASLKYLKRAQELGLIINTIDIAGTYMIGLNLKESQVFFSTEKDVEKQLTEFETIIRHFKVQGQKFKKLDLRFNKPVVQLN